jgi:hypothetical protein
MKSIKMLYTDSESGEILDYTDIVVSASISSSIGSQSGRCEIEIVGDGSGMNFGSVIEVFNGEIGVYRGFLFNVKMEDDRHFRSIFYDQTRYLRNVDVFVYKDMTASKLFKHICQVHELSIGIVDDSSYALEPALCEGRSLWDIMRDAIDSTLAHENNLYVIRDVFGKLEFRNIDNLRSDFVIDDENVAIGYEFEIGIDKDTFNYIRIGFEDSNANERKWGFYEDPDLVNKWGRLQFYRLMRERMSKDNLETLAKQLLVNYARPTRDVRLTCFGDFNVSAGSGVNLSLDRIQAFRGMNRYYVTSCTHKIENCIHTMDLSLAIDSFGD